jgi:deoxyribonuclease-4
VGGGGAAPRDPVAVVVAERARRVLGQRVAIALAVGGAHERRNHLDVPLGDLRRLAPEIREPEVDVQLQQIDAGGVLGHASRVETAPDVIRSPAPLRGRTGHLWCQALDAAQKDNGGCRLGRMGELRFGPARVPSRESPEEAIAILQERGYTACEIDFEGKFWMDYPWAEKFGELAREAGIVLSVHAPIAGFMGHAERGKKLNMAVGMLDHSAGIAKTAGAEVVVFHPGFLLGRERDAAIDSVVEQLGELRERLEKKDRAVPFGVEVMGRVRELGTAEDVFAISARTGWVRPVIDFAHLHAVTDGGFTETSKFEEILEGADAVIPPDAPFHIHFSDIAYANRNETKHLPYGEGTLRVEPLGLVLRNFDRPATVITESPDEESNQAIREELYAAVATRSASRASSSSASASRSRSRKNSA